MPPMLGQAAALTKRPPHANGSLDGSGNPHPMAVQDNVAVTAISTDAILVLATGGIPMGGCWVTFVCDVDAYIHFDYSASLPAASPTVSGVLAANIPESIWVNEGDQYFRIIRKSADGTLRRWRSNQ